MPRVLSSLAWLIASLHTCSTFKPSLSLLHMWVTLNWLLSVVTELIWVSSTFIGWAVSLILVYGTNLGDPIFYLLMFCDSHMFSSPDQLFWFISVSRKKKRKFYVCGHCQVIGVTGPHCMGKVVRNLKRNHYWVAFVGSSFLHNPHAFVHFSRLSRVPASRGHSKFGNNVLNSNELDGQAVSSLESRTVAIF